MSLKDAANLSGELTVEVFGGNGELKSREVIKNLITSVGDQYYMGRAVQTTGLPPMITGMKLGTGSTAPAKTGAGAALVSYLANSHQALDTNPTAANGSTSYVATFAPGKATSVNPITEVVLVNESLVDSTSSSSNTIARALISTVPVKNAEDEVVITWTHTLVGAQA